MDDMMIDLEIDRSNARFEDKGNSVELEGDISMIVTEDEMDSVSA